jgi:hypothetical protein
MLLIFGTASARDPVIRKGALYTTFLGQVDPSAIINNTFLARQVVDSLKK